jgi:hypothetical protein
VWVGYSWYSNRKYSDICNKCGGSGWYIPSHWNVLERISFGEYLFHKPVGRSYNKPEVGSTIIEGYVEHNPSKFSYIARIILNLLYDCRGYKKRWRFGFGSGYYINHGWKINRLFNNLVYVIKHKGNYLPIIKKRMASVRPAVTGSLDVAMDYLPF